MIAIKLSCRSSLAVSDDAPAEEAGIIYDQYTRYHGSYPLNPAHRPNAWSSSLCSTSRCNRDWTVSQIRLPVTIRSLPVMCVRFHQARYVEDQRNPAVAGNSRPGKPCQSLQESTQRLDHYLFLADQLFDYEADPLVTDVHDHHMVNGLLAGCRA